MFLVTGILSGKSMYPLLVTEVRELFPENPVVVKVQSEPSSLEITSFKDLTEDKIHENDSHKFLKHKGAIQELGTDIEFNLEPYGRATVTPMSHISG